MTPLEQRLARRIHKQRCMIRELEGRKSYMYRAWMRWMDMAQRLARENRDLKQRLEGKSE